MKPNNSGGWTAEGNSEISALIESLFSANQLDLALTISGQIRSRREQILRAHPEFMRTIVSDLMIDIIAEDDFIEDGIIYQDNLPMTHEQTEAAMEALRASSSSNGSLLDQEARFTAVAMVNTYGQAA